MSLVLLTAMVGIAPPVVLHSGMTITKSCAIQRQTYRFPSQEGTKAAGDETIPTLTPAIRIKGKHIVVDFSNAVLQGSDQSVLPTERKGLGVEVSGSDITIKNLRVHGYKVGLIARNCKNLKIIDSDFSYNWKQHLLSTLDKEDESDWMSYHHNEHDEWLRYGAGIYLSNVSVFEVQNVRIVGGQCGLMLNRSDSGLIWNNTFSFLSGVGLGMYRTNYCFVKHNNIDWCVRGYSHGVYNRGQDSAGILIFEQCTRNLFAFNSVTHGGDGFFMWAGQTTMDTGTGGCNGNLVFANDFSHAPTNGIEATFSANRFVNNLVLECWHGVWGGYSYQTSIEKNHFGDNEVGIAIEHGQHNAIVGNTFSGDKTGIELWQNRSQDQSLGYVKHHDTVSHDYQILQNDTFGVRKAISLRDTRDVAMRTNGFFETPTILETLGATPGLVFHSNRSTEPAKLPSGIATTSNVWNVRFAQKPEAPAWKPYSKAFLLMGITRMKGGKDPFLKAGTLRGRKYILVDEWGPYDFQHPILWPRGDGEKPGTKRFEILGPKGTWKLASTQGVEAMPAESGTVPGFIDVNLPAGKAGLTAINLIYTGAQTTDFRGIVTPAGKPVPFGYRHFFAPIDWTVNFYRWQKSENESDPHAAPLASELAADIKGEPLKTVKTDRLEFAGASFAAGVPTERFATIADGYFTIPTGVYVLGLTTDDGARVYVDGKLVIGDAWHYQAPTSYQATLHLGGKHHIRVEHFQIDGYATLKVDLKPKE